MVRRHNDSGQVGEHPLKILLTNDDGVHAKGLWTVARALKAVGEVLVVAPDRDQSGISSAVTLHHPIRAREVAPQSKGVMTYAVEGTPSDSVILALERLAEGKVDLVVSGINEGANLGEDILLSGTVGAAFQGYFRGIPSMAVSVASLTKVRYGPAAAIVRGLAQAVAAGSLKSPLLLNVNVPNVPVKEIKGIDVTQMGNRTFMDVAEEGHDGRRTYYWIKRNRPTGDLKEGTDIWSVRNKRISITPLSAQLTDSEGASGLAELSKDVFRAVRPE